MKKQLLITPTLIMLLCLLALNTSLMAQTDRILHFDGTNDYVRLPYNAALRLDSSFTIEAWFVIDGDSPGGNIISTHMNVNGTTRAGYAIEYDGTNIKGLIGINGAWELVSAPVNINRWYHIAFVFEKGLVDHNLLLYLDGVLVNSISTVNDKIENVSDVWIGGAPNYSGNYWKGVTDEVRIWNTARTETEINANKDIELNGTETGLVAYYNFNQGTPGGDNTAETTLFDNGPNAFHGTLENFTLQGCSSNWLNTRISLVSTTDISISNPNTTIIANGECLSGSCSNTYHLNEVRYGHVCSLQDDVSLLTPGILKTEYSDSLQTQFASEFTGLDRTQKWYVRAYAINVGNDTLYSDIDSILIWGHQPFDPILISQPADLDSIRNFLADPTLYFRLVNDIDLSDYLAPGGDGYAKWGADGWLPIGDDAARFEATFFGSGHAIYGLVINRPTSDYIGLFGYTIGAEIDSLHIIDANVTGNNFVGPLSARNSIGNISYCSATGTVVANTNNGGGLSGWNSGTVSECYANTNVSSGGYAGGLVGYSNGLVKNSYAHGDVSSNGQYCGGFIGRNGGDIDMCYSAGLVSGTATDIGGFAGDNFQTISNSFWDTETSGMTISDGGTGKTTSEMKTLSTFTGAGWDFVNETTNGTENLWNILLVDITGIISYPFLEKNKEVPEPGKDTIYAFAPGSGDGSSPDQAFLIENKTQLNNVRHIVGAHYRQIADIVFTSSDFQTGGQFYNNGTGWVPIGIDSTSIYPFTGSYNGDGYNIDSLYMNHSSESPIFINGFFYTADNARIENVNLRDVNIQGDFIGGFICTDVKNTEIDNCSIGGEMSGFNYSASFSVYLRGGNKISNCTSTVNMTKRGDGSDYSGFVIEVLSTDSIINCSYNGEINTNGYGGTPAPAGFVAKNYGYISNCSASGTIISGFTTSGFVNDNDGTIENSHADMLISSSNTSANIAGFAGSNSSGGKITRCYSSGSINGNFASAAGFVRRNFSQIEYSYSLTDISGMDNIAGFALDNRGSIKKSYSRGTLTRSAGSTGENLAAFVVDCIGATSSIAQCYTTSPIQYIDGGIPADKGFVLNAENTDNISDSYFDTQTTGQNTGTGATGLLTAEMKSEEISATWNFYDVDGWRLDSLVNDGYPVIRDTARTVELSGSGTAGDPYIIDHWSKLRKLSNDTSLWHSHFIQTADIELPYFIREWNNGNFPLRIGINADLPFTGSYDGQNHTISNFYARTDQSGGLFGYSVGAELKNIFLYADIAVNRYSGILCYDFRDGYMENCHTYGVFSAVGGAGIAYLIRNSTVINCGNNATITPNKTLSERAWLSGFVRYVYDSDIIECYNKGDFIGENSEFSDAAGFITDVKRSNILKCYNEGSASNFREGSGTTFTSFIMTILENTVVDQCYASGSIVDDDIRNVSGFISSSHTGSIVKNSYSTVDMHSTTAGVDNNFPKFRFVNMFSDSRIENCYYAGNITFPDPPDEIVLVNNSEYSINNCFADTMLINISRLNGIIGKSTTDMKTQSTFTDAGWDFVCETTNGTEQIWAMNGTDNNGYPYLAWQGYTYETTPPEITSTHNAQTVDANSNCKASLPDYTSTLTATDNCAAVDDLTITQTPVAGTTISGATNTVTLKVTDENANYAEVSFNVEVVDNTAPVPDIATLSDITAECQVTSLTAPTATDNCAGTITGTHEVTLPITTQGTTLVAWTYDDGNGNTSTQTQNVVIEDVTIPTISCIADQTITLNSGETFYTVQGAEFDPNSSDDNCGVASVLNDFNNLATLENVQLPIGTTTITWTVTDSAGNTNSCIFNILVDNATGFTTLGNFLISIHPNPVSDELNIQLDGNAINLNFEIINSIGIVVYKGNIVEKTIVQASNFAPGIYLIKFDNDKTNGIKKIIKE